MSTAANAPTTAAPSGFLPERIVHLHPTRRCNLACAHCYSASSPQQDAGLDLALLRRALPRLRAEGYTQISVSGGEPLVFPDLVELVVLAQAEGFRVTMITNGLLVGQRRMPLMRRLDGVAVSFDGLEQRHDALRGRTGAFAAASQALARLRDAGVRAAAALSVTRDGLPELPDLALHVVQQGAQALQIRPVAAAGRAPHLDASLVRDDHDRLRLYLVTMALQQELAPDVRVHGDLAPARALWRQREAYAALLAQCDLPQAARRPLSELVNPLVITETGQLLPVAYDLHPAFSVGTLALDRQGAAHGLGGLDDASLTHHARHGHRALARLIGTTLAGLAEHPGVVDWFDLLARASHRHPMALRPAA